MANPWFSRWTLALVLIVLVLALVATATVVLASAVLQPKVVPTVKVQPGAVEPGDVVIVSGEGWPYLPHLILVVALSPTQDLASEGLLPVSATTVKPDGTMAASFVFPSDIPWDSVREAWVVVRPGSGNMQAAARLAVHHPAPTPTPTPALAITPIPGRPQVQGTIDEVVSHQGLLVLRPFDGSARCGVSITNAVVRYLDGRQAAFSDLQVGIAIAAEGWYDSGGTLLAEQITILEVTGAPLSVLPAATPCAQVAVAPVVTVCPVVVPVSLPTAVPPTKVCLPTRTPQPPPVRPTPPPVFVPTDAWLAEFYDNPTMSGLPAFVREAEVIDFDWRFGPPISGLPRESYSIRWTGLWTFPRTCQYRFRLLLKGAARLSVDDRVILNLWDCPPAAEYQADIGLAQGAHKVRLEFRPTGPQARVQLRWEYAMAAP